MTLPATACSLQAFATTRTLRARALQVQEVWKLRLSIELPELGALEVEVALKGGRVNVQLMGNDTSVAQFERSSEYLSSQLIMAGLKIDGVSAMRAPAETARKSEIQENGFSAFV